MSDIKYWHIEYNKFSGMCFESEDVPKFNEFIDKTIAQAKLEAYEHSLMMWNRLPQNMIKRQLQDIVKELQGGGGGE